MATQAAVMESPIDDLLQGYLDRMRAPAEHMVPDHIVRAACAWVDEDDDPSLLDPGWLRRDVILSSLVGLGLGVMAFVGLRPGLTGPPPGPAATFRPAAAVATALQDASADRQDQADQTDQTELALLEPVAEVDDDLNDEELLELESILDTDLRRGPRPGLAHRRATHRRESTRSAPTLVTQHKRLLQKGWQLYRRGDYRLAGVAFGRATHLEPKRTAGYSGLALCLFEQGEEAAAMQVLERGVKMIGPKSNLWLLAGAIYQWKGEQKHARKAYRRYLRDNPHGRYARDARVLLSYKRLPELQAFDLAEADDGADEAR